MSQTTITKSIRLSSNESDEIARLSTKFGMSEAALMKKWVLDGIRAQNLEIALQAYMQRKTDLRGGAVLAGISYNEFLQEVQARNIVVFENPQFLDELEFLANAFANETLRKAVQKVRHSAVDTIVTSA
jgi:predicted HTH domain antitoxin